MKTKRTKLIATSFLLLALVVSPLLNACSSPSPQGQTKTIKIGVIVTLTGVGSESGIRNWDGAQLFRDWFNSKGGIQIKGEKYLLELVAEDDKLSAEGATSAATKLIEQHKVNFIQGGIPPFIIVAYGAVTEPAKVLRATWLGAGIPEEMNANTPYTFRTFQGFLDGTDEAYKYLLEAYPNVKRVAMVNPDDGAAPYIFSACQKSAEKVGVQVVAKETYSLDTQDFYPVVTKLLASKPDAINSGGGFAIMQGGIIKAARELGFKGPFFSVGPVPADDIVTFTGKELGTDFFTMSVYEQSPNVPLMAKEIRKLANEKKLDALFTDLSTPWDGLWTMLQAVEKAQSLDSTEVAKVWEQMDDIETVFGKGKMGGAKTYGVNHVLVRPLSITRVMNGQPEIVRWVTPDIP